MSAGNGTCPGIAERPPSPRVPAAENGRGPIDAERYYELLGELAAQLVEAETELRRAAAKAPTTAGREEALAAADGLSAERRRLRALAARETERLRGPGRSRPVLRDRFAIGALEIDPASRRVSVGGEEVKLSAKEYEVLRMLASEPTRVFTKQELLREVWGYRSTLRTRTLDTHASRLRRKLNGAPDRHYVRNCWGVGYRLVDEPQEAAVG
jgi:DNA-binding response OmpR family regulator